MGFRRFPGSRQLPKTQDLGFKDCNIKSWVSQDGQRAIGAGEGKDELSAGWLTADSFFPDSRFSWNRVPIFDRKFGFQASPPSTLLRASF